MRPWNALALVVIVWCAGPSFAKPGTGAGAAVVKAKEHFDRGQSLYLRESYPEAAAAFLAAYRLKDYPVFLFNAAVCQEKARRYRAAADLFRGYLGQSPSGADREVIVKRIARLEQHLGAQRAAGGAPTSQSAPPASAPAPTAALKLPPLDTKGLVVIDSQPPGAYIYLNDRRTGPVGRTPWHGTLAPGEYHVLVEAQRHRSETLTIRPGADRLLVLSFALRPDPARAWIVIDSNVPGADVFIGEETTAPVGRTPYRGPLAPGSYVVSLRREGYLFQERRITVAAGDVRRLRVALELVPYGWVAVRGGKAAAGTAVLINEEPRCHAPCRVRLTPGTYRLVLQRPGYKTYRGTVTVGRAEETAIGARMSRAPSRVSAWVAFFFSGTLLGAGTYFGIKSRSERQEIEDALAAGQLVASDDSRINAGWTHAVAADALFVLGGVTALLGVYYALRSPGPDTKVTVATKRFAVTPVAGPGGVGLEGRF